MRYVVWFGMVVMPILIQIVGDLVPNRHLLVSPTRNHLNYILAALIALPMVLVQPWWVEQAPLPETYWSQVHRGADVGPLLTTSTPVGAARYLVEHPGGQLFNEMGYGSYLIWAVPEARVFADPRVELYPYELWLDYTRISSGVRCTELLSAYGADRILLRPDTQTELAALIEEDPLWLLEYEDTDSQLWLRVLPWP